jgi:glycosyl transferase family 2
VTWEAEAMGAQLERQWGAAVADDGDARAQWQVDEGDGWSWQPEGVLLEASGRDWSGLGWRQGTAATLTELRNFVVEVTVTGTADAAGLSFGPYRDFLVSVNPATGPRRLQLEVDAAAGCWTFRADGRLLGRNWWDSGVQSVEDLVGGRLTLKGHRPERVLFRDLAIHRFEASCRLSVVVACYRFLQRLRVTLRNWCHQELPTGSYEVIVINPDSPDGTHEHLAAVARSYPQVRIRELAVHADQATNKGAMINRAVETSRGSWVWLTDADCLFSASSAATVMDRLDDDPDRLLFAQRRHLTPTQTDGLLSGRHDGLRQFDELSANASPQAPDHAPWGYTQIVHRSILHRLRYREEFNHFAHSDLAFVDDCRSAGVNFQPIDDLTCLHLHHPFAWYGTNVFL